MKKIKYLVVSILLILSLTACSGIQLDKLVETMTATEMPDEKEKAVGNVTPEPGTTDAVTPDPTATPAVTPAATPTAVPTSTPEPSPTPLPTEEPTPTIELLVKTNVDKELLNKIFTAYDEYLVDDMNRDSFERFNTLKFGLAFINDDDIPELLISDDTYHACGVRVLCYDNGKVVQIGEFGEFGSMQYQMRSNRIISTYMGMGQQELSIIHINPDYSTGVDLSMSGDTNGMLGYFIDGNEVKEEYFLEVYDEQFKGDAEHHVIYVSNEKMAPYNPHVVYMMTQDVMMQMYDELQNENFAEFTLYRNEKMDDLTGTWDLYEGYVSLYKENLNFTYLPYESYQESGYKVLSAATITDKINFWVSGYDEKDDPMNDITVALYNMDMEYWNIRINDWVDYGWCVRGLSEDSNEWDVYACLDDKDHLYLCLYRDTGETYTKDGREYPQYDYIQLKYERIFYEYDYYTVNARIERDESADKNGKLAFKGYQYYYITKDDKDLIKQFGLDKKLNGQDHVVYYVEEEPFTFYIDEDTYVQLIDYDDWYYMKGDYTEVGDYRSNVFYLFFKEANKKGNCDGLIASAIREDYRLVL